MQIGTAFVFLLMLGAALAFVGWPLASPARAEDEPTARQRRREELQEQKERLLSALRDLDLDHRTGKTDDEDHAALSAKLKAEAAETMKQLDVLDGEPPVRKPGALDEDAARKFQLILQRSLEYKAHPELRVDGEVAKRVRALLERANQPFPSDPVQLAALSREIGDLYLRYVESAPAPQQARTIFETYAGAPPASPAPAAVAGARFCTKCGWKAKAGDDRFCGRCGAALPTDG